MKTKVYLAGGFHGDWQIQVKQHLIESFIFFDPKEHRLEDKTQYTQWDLHHIAKSDILFGYMSKTNPSGYGLALEIGYARALNKMVILVDEKSAVDVVFDKYFAIAHKASSVTFDNLQDGIDYLKKF